MKKIFIFFLLLSTIAHVMAQSLDDARQSLLEGDYWKTARILDKLESDNPKVKSSAQYAYVKGACEFEMGNYGEARDLLESAKKKGNGAANLYLGKLAFLDFDFDRAAELYGEYGKYSEKNGGVGAEALEESERQLEVGRNALSRVEKVVVIDSIALPADDFFKSYKLPASSGRLLLPMEIPLEDHQPGAVMAFMNEGEDYLIWGEADSVGNVHLVESLRLLDGSWQQPSPASPILNRGGYSDYPFMMADGVTLYYASSGRESIGGYDIFVATRDPSTGEFLQPQNIGMPFNSPYDDFMLAIDEENGVGWWATDRNLLGDRVTVYVYLLNDLRRNYDPDDERLIEMARLSDFHATQNPDDREKYEEILSLIEGIDPDHVETAPEFRLPIGDGKYYTHYSDFNNSGARDTMRKYVAARKKFDSTESYLQKLYRRYSANHADNVRQDILNLESELENQRKILNSIRSDIYRLENITK